MDSAIQLVHDNLKESEEIFKHDYKGDHSLRVHLVDISTAVRLLLSRLDLPRDPEAFSFFNMSIGSGVTFAAAILGLIKVVIELNLTEVIK